MSVTGADSDSDHSLVPELEQATFELEVDIDMMLAHAYQLLNHDRDWQLGVTCLTKTLDGAKSMCITGWRAGPVWCTHSGVPCVCRQLLAFMLATILELCFMLTLCYYSQNYAHNYRKPRVTCIQM